MRRREITWQDVKNNKLQFTIMTGLCLYAFYEKIYYVGLFRFLAELQLNHFGQYYEKITLIFSLIIYVVLFALIGKLFPALKIDLDLNEIKEQQEVTKAQKKMREAKMVLFVGAGILAAFLIFMFTDTSVVGDNDAPTSLIAGRDTSPKSAWVDIQGVAQMEYVIGYRIKKGSSEKNYLVVPITAPDWKSGHPVQYFIRSESGQLSDLENQIHNIRKEQKSFLTQTTGIVKKNGLEGMVAEDYKRQLVLAEPYYVIENREPVRKTAVVGRMRIFLALFSVGILGFALYLFVRAKMAEEKEG
jgi:hypothetical protein